MSKKPIVTIVTIILCVILFATGCSNNTDSQESGTDNGKINIENGTDDASGGESEAETESLTKGEYKASDYATLTSYKGLEISKSDVEVKDEEIQTEVDSLISANATIKKITNRKVKDGDVVNIDYVGKKDGEAFDGGSAQGYDLTIGSNSFIEGFETALIGVKPGKTKNIDLTFPEDYKSTDLAGQAVTFEVKVNYIAKTVNPDYTDKFVKSVTEYSTIKDYEKSVKDSLYKSKLDKAVVNQMVTNCTVNSYPDTLLAYYQNMIVNYVKQQASYYGYSYTDYLTANNYTEDTFNESYVKPNSESIAKQDLAFDLVIEQEGIQINEDDYNKALEGYAADYSMTVDELKENMTDDNLKTMYLQDKATKVMADNAVVK